MNFTRFPALIWLSNRILWGASFVVAKRQMQRAACFSFPFFLCVTMSSALAASAGERWSGYAESVFQHYTQDTGLPQPTVTALTEDREGFLWIGTQGGLSRWDGYRFRNYLPNLKVPGSIPDNFISVLHTDANGQLWVGTSTGGLVRYDGLKDQFVKLAGLSSSEVTAIADDGAGGLWVATAAGLNHLNTKTGSIRVWHHNVADPSSLPDEQIMAVIQDHQGQVWVGTKSVLARFDPVAEKFAQIPVVARTGPVSNFRNLHEDRKGRLWIGTNHNGAFVIANANDKPQQVTETDKGKSSFSSDYVISISEAGDGEIWLATYGDGIVALNSETLQSRHIRHDVKIFASLQTDQIWTVYLDHTGSMLVGNNNGLDRLVNGDSAFLSIFGGTNRTSGIAADDVVSLFESDNGLVWVGSSSSGVDVIGPAGEHVALLKPDQNNPEQALSKGAISAFTSDGRSVFIGTDRGVYRTDMKGKGLQRIALQFSERIDAVNALLYDEGILYLGGNREGLYAQSMDGKVKPVFSHLDEKDLTDQRVNVILRGQHKELWVGTANGLNHVDLATGVVEKIPFNPDNPDGLSAGYISSLFVDQQGRLWVALFGGGINVSTGRDSNGKMHFRKISTEDGLPNNNVDTLLQDNRGQIWASTDGGICSINPGTFAVHSYHRADGVAVSTYWVNSGIKTQMGELIFGGNGGMTVIRPDEVKDWNYRPPLVVTDAHSGAKLVPVYGTITAQNPVLVRPEANSIAVEFSALDYTAPERNLYSYRLEGFDKYWTDTDYTRRLASYTNLPPGRYSLQVRGSNRNGVWTEKTLSIPVHVLPAWYQTWLFRISITLAGMLLVVLLVQARTAYLRKAKLELEELIALRTQELFKSTEQLRQSKIQLEEIAFLDALTGLPNRRLFSERFENFKAAATRDNKNFALLLIDLDKFKYINDNYGHDAGDAVLVATSERLLKATRAVDVVARLGGDEFAILLDGADPAISIKVVCERIMQSCLDPIVFSNQQFMVTMSIGAAIYLDHGSFQAELYKSADMALYEAKGSGRNTWRCYGHPAIDQIT